MPRVEKSVAVRLVTTNVTEAGAIIGMSLAAYSWSEAFPYVDCLGGHLWSEASVDCRRMRAMTNVARVAARLFVVVSGWAAPTRYGLGGRSPNACMCVAPLSAKGSCLLYSNLWFHPVV